MARWIWLFFLGGFNVATLIPREMFQDVSPEVLSLLGSVGLSLRFWHMYFGFRMTYSLLPPEQLLYCVPGSNASCVMIAILGNSLVILSTCHFKPLLGPTNVLTTSFFPVAAHVCFPIDGADIMMGNEGKKTGGKSFSCARSCCEYHSWALRPG